MRNPEGRPPYETALVFTVVPAYSYYDPEPPTDDARRAVVTTLHWRHGPVVAVTWLIRRSGD